MAHLISFATFNHFHIANYIFCKSTVVVVDVIIMPERVVWVRVFHSNDAPAFYM